MEITEIARVFGVLIMVIALMLVALKLVKGLALPGSSDGNIRIHGQHALGGRDKLLIVQVDSQRLLLGVSAQGINKISDLEPLSEPPQPATAEMPQWLSRWLIKDKS